MVFSQMSVVIVPVIKDKVGKVGSSDNYRPIALASTISKVLKKIILDRIIHLVGSSDNQFGFKPKFGTDMYIYVLKEIINDYKRKKLICVYLLFRCI